VGLLVAVLVISLFEADLFKPSSPPMQIRGELEAWNQAITFLKTRLDTGERVQLPIYSPAFVRQVSPGTWEVNAGLDLLDEDGIRKGRKVFRILEKWDESAGWSLLDLSISP
jgi:hypothetical protein